MAIEDGIMGDSRKRQDESFRSQDGDLIERLRRASVAEQERHVLETHTGIHDAAMLEQLQELGFTPATIALLPLIPVLQVAWAEGRISGAERTAILNLARARGIEIGNDADHQLIEWLDRPPSPDTFGKATRLIAAMVEDPTEALQDMSADDLLRYCEQIAHASGGIFGIGVVSTDERKALEQITSQLKNR